MNNNKIKYLINGMFGICIQSKKSLLKLNSIQFKILNSNLENNIIIGFEKRKKSITTMPGNNLLYNFFKLFLKYYSKKFIFYNIIQI